jgi:hypothetical protein
MTYRKRKVAENGEFDGTNEELRIRKKNHLWDERIEVPHLKQLYLKYGYNISQILASMIDLGHTQLTEQIIRSKLNQAPMKLWRESTGLVSIR